MTILLLLILLQCESFLLNLQELPTCPDLATRLKFESLKIFLPPIQNLSWQCSFTWKIIDTRDATRTKLCTIISDINTLHNGRM